MGLRESSMADFLRAYQLDIMLALIGVCGITAFFVHITGTLSKKRKTALLLLELYSTVLLLADRFAYIYRGDVSRTGYWMVRISNFLVFFMTLAIVQALILYIHDLLMNEGGLKEPPLSIKVAEVTVVVGEVLVIISQFTGLYYTFDENNYYTRSPLYPVSFVFPTTIFFIIMTLLIKYRNRFRKLILYPLMLFVIVPVLAAFVQLFSYGLSLINMSIIMYRVFSDRYCV